MDFLLGVALWSAATGTALRALKKARVSFCDAQEALVFSSALGLGFLAYVIFLVGSLKMLYAPILAVLLAGMFLFSLKPFLAEMSAVFEKKGARRFFPEMMYVLPACVVLIFSLAGVLAPPTGQDELCYHLAQPKNYIREHAVYEVPYSTSALWPYLMEMLFTLGMLLRGPELAKFFHWALTLTAVWAIHCFAKRFFGPRPAFFAALVFWMTPAVFIQSSFAYVDNALACYIFLTLYAWAVYAQTGKISWAVLAGVLAGLAVSVKLIGLFVLPSIALLQLLFARTKKRSLTALVCFFAAAFFSGGLWYVRSALLRGNPVFPFYPEYFGGHGWSIPTYVDAHGRGQDLLSFLSLLWDTALHPQWFGGEHIGPFYLAIVPLIIFIRPWNIFLKYSLLMAVCYTALWFVIDPNIRFFFPVLALLSPSAGLAMAWLSEASSKAFRVFAHGLFILMFGVQAVFAFYHFKDAIGLWFGADRQRYVSERDRSFDAAGVVNQHLKTGDKVISVGEVRAFHFEVPFVIEGELNRFTNYGSGLSSVAQVHDFLKKEGFTHLLYYNASPLEQKEKYPLRLPYLLQEGILPAGLFKETARIASGNFHYVLYDIK